ncbi:MAG: Co2+/Mg2+ efflux protein ApaG [Gluconacetobacter diazotrophicus]|nr:Co2+/Mg2+ efflux protein ApaG [Gluconacetobacter diazotrophicus]
MVRNKLRPPPGASSERDPAGTEGEEDVQVFSATTRDIKVSVRTVFLEDQSKPEERHYLWAYRIRIENHGADTVRLLDRSWRITDAGGQTVHVEGEGVVGEQPTLAADEAFEYTSGTPLATPTGFMSGRYGMVVVASGERFDVAVPTFSLDSPHQSGLLH